MIKNILCAALIASSAFGAAADNYDTMYLIKGNHVVGKYATEDVDYVSFTLPEGVEDKNISIKLDDVTKNSVTYTVTTVNANVAYAHNILSYYDVNYMAMDYMGDYFENLDEATQQSVIQLTLSYNAYLAMGTQTFKQRDFELDGTSEGSRFSVVPGSQYFLCAWEVNPSDGSPLETFIYKEFKTPAPEKGIATLDCTQGEQNQYGLVVDFSGSNVYYVRTCWGAREVMDAYVETFGIDFLMGTFGQAWTLDFLQSTGDMAPGVPNSIWPLDGSRDYVLFTRAYDSEGNVTDGRFYFTADEASEDEGPEIKIFSKQKDNSSVSVNFEITPSNVEEAYVRLCSENFVSDRLNMGYELYEIAMGGDAEDITSTINRTGEYTYSATGLSEEWKALLITAKDKDGNRTTLRINFYPDNDSDWDIYKPVYGAPAKKLPAVKRIVSKRNPTIPRK